MGAAAAWRVAPTAVPGMVPGGASIEARPSTQSSSCGFRRPFFLSLLCFLACRRFRFSRFESVRILFFFSADGGGGGAARLAAASSIWFVLAMASRKFMFCVRCLELETASSQVPSRTTSRERSDLRSSLMAEGEMPCRLRSNRTSAFVSTLFTFCPPFPPLLEKEHDTASSVTSTGRKPDRHLLLLLPLLPLLLLLLLLLLLPLLLPPLLPPPPPPAVGGRMESLLLLAGGAWFQQYCSLSKPRKHRNTHEEGFLMRRRPIFISDFVLTTHNSPLWVYKTLGIPKLDPFPISLEVLQK